MSKITDPDMLSVYVHATSAAGATTEEVVVLTGPKTVQLRVAGNLDDTAPGKTSGVTARANYSFMKEEYLNGTDAATLRRFRFPWKMIFEGSFIWVNGWAPADQQTRDLIRDAGYYEQVASYSNACMITLNEMDDDASDLAYFKQVAGFSASVTDYDKTGQLNENIDITGVTGYKKSFLREQGKLYSEYDLLAEYDITAITYQAYSFPLPNGNDAKVTHTDVYIEGNTPYTGMKVNYLKGVGFTTWADSIAYPVAAVVKDNLTDRWWFTPAGGTSSGTSTADDTGVTDWEAYDGEELIGSTYYVFNRVVTANGGTDAEAHEHNMHALRQATDINADDTTSVNQQGFGTVNGNVALVLDEYVGDTMHMEPGCVIRGFDTNSTNSIVHHPIKVDTGGVNSEGFPLSSTEVFFPFVSAGNFTFSDNINDELDVETWFSMYFAWITSTVSTGIAITSASGATAVLDYTLDTGILDHLVTGDYIDVDGYTGTATNNGLYILTGDPTANTIAVTKQDGVTVIDETASDSVTVLENPFESPGAVIVKDNSTDDITGQVTGLTLPWDFDFTNNNQGGRTANTNAPVVVVASALDGAEWVEASYTITAAVGQNIPVNPSDELNYVNT